MRRNKKKLTIGEQIRLKKLGAGSHPPIIEEEEDPEDTLPPGS